MELSLFQEQYTLRKNNAKGVCYLFASHAPLLAQNDIGTCEPIVHGCPSGVNFPYLRSTDGLSKSEADQPEV